MTTDPKLDQNTLYLGARGRIFCGKIECAGFEAAMTGYEIGSENPVSVLDEAERAYLVEHGLTAACETCGHS